MRAIPLAFRFLVLPLTVLRYAIQFKQEEFAMRTAQTSKKVETTRTASPLMVRLDNESKKCLSQAAELRRISVSDYVRTVTVPQARREVRSSREQVITLTPEEQLAFWNALNEKPKMTDRQRKLGRVIRGES